MKGGDRPTYAPLLHTNENLSLISYSSYDGSLGLPVYWLVARLLAFEEISLAHSFQIVGSFLLCTPVLEYFIAQIPCPWYLTEFSLTDI